MQETDYPGVQVVESGKAEVIADDVEEMLIARIPLNANPRRPRTYLTAPVVSLSASPVCWLALALP